MLRHVQEEEFECFCLLELFVYLLFLLDKEDLLLVIMETFCQRGTFGSKLTLNLSIYIYLDKRFQMVFWVLDFHKATQNKHLAL